MAKWADKDDVLERLGSHPASEVTPGIIQKKIDRAEEYLRSKLVTIFSASDIDAWTKIENTPQEIRAMVADRATALVYSEEFHQSMSDKTTLAASFQSQVDQSVKDLLKGKKEIIDASGEEVAEVSDAIAPVVGEVSTAFFTANHPKDSNFGEGSLDDF